jgi:hypothetical protein
MNIVSQKAICITVTLVLLCVGAAGKRVSPAPVTPVIADGVQYSAANDGRNVYVIATQTGTGKELWRVKVFHTRINFWIEEDVQWVFITNLRIVGNSLFVRDEKARCYRIDLRSRKVSGQQCGEAFPSESSNVTR